MPVSKRQARPSPGTADGDSTYSFPFQPVRAGPAPYWAQLSCTVNVALAWRPVRRPTAVTW